MLTVLIAIVAATLTVPEDIRSHREGLAVWWTGNAGWLIKADGVLIGVDLDLDAQGKLHSPPITAQELA